jgi:hypothetical protein
VADELDAIGLVLLHVRQVVSHWRAFGPEAAFARAIDALDAAFQEWQRIAARVEWERGQHPEEFMIEETIGMESPQQGDES